MGATNGSTTQPITNHPIHDDDPTDPHAHITGSLTHAIGGANASATTGGEAGPPLATSLEYPQTAGRGVVSLERKIMCHTRMAWV